MHLFSHIIFIINMHWATILLFLPTCIYEIKSCMSTRPHPFSCTYIHVSCETRVHTHMLKVGLLHPRQTKTFVGIYATFSVPEQYCRKISFQNFDSNLVLRYWFKKYSSSFILASSTFLWMADWKSNHRLKIKPASFIPYQHWSFLLCQCPILLFFAYPSLLGRWGQSAVPAMIQCREG